MKRQASTGFGSDPEDETPGEFQVKQRITSRLTFNDAVAADSEQVAGEVVVSSEIILGDLARRALSNLGTNDLARVAVESLGKGFDLDACGMLGTRGDVLVPRSGGVYIGPRAVAPLEINVDEGTEIVKAIQLRGEYSISDTKAAPEADPALRRLIEAVSARALIAVPIIFSIRARALLVLVQQRRPREWSSLEQYIAREASTIISIAQRQSEQLEEAKRVGDRETQLRRIGRALRSSLGIDHVLKTSVEQIGMAVQVDRLRISRFEENGQMQPLWEFRGLPRETASSVAMDDTPIDVSPQAHVMLVTRGAAIVVDENWRRTTVLDIARPRPHDEVLVCPILTRGSLWGVLEIERQSKGWLWRAGECDFITQVAENLAMAIHQARLFEQVLRSQREWESTFDGLSDAIIIYDNARSIRRTNLAASTLLNQSLEALVGRRCCDVGLCTGPDGCGLVRAIDERTRVSIEVLSPRTYHVLHVAMDPILDEQGEVIGVAQLVRDLDDLRRTEAELRRQQHFLANLVESANDAIFVVDLAGRFVWSNSHLMHLTGRMVSEMLGKQHTHLVAEEAREELDSHFRAATTGETRRFEAAIHNTASGEERRVVLTFSPINEEGEVVSVLGVARDVTEEKRIAERSQQADKLRALGQLASGVAHDVNNDLAAILGRVQRLMRTTRSKKLRADLQVIETAALDSAQTVRRIQNFARQQGNADFEAVDANGLVRDAIEITRTRWHDDALSRGIDYSVEFEATNLSLLLGDGSQLREVFVNLIINALDAMPDGGALRIYSAEEHGEVQIRFVDEGQGIPPRIRERIFEPFFSTKGASGTGMGLAVSYGIVTRHNGRIEVESEVGEGTRFAVVLPVTDTPVETAVAPPIVAVDPLRAMVVDDEHIVREVLADLLEEQGHTVLQFEHGTQAVAFLEGGTVDVIFTDLSMPMMDGWAVASTVRELAPEIKIVLVTGYGVSVAAPEDRPNLVDAIIGKPFEYDDIAALLGRLFAH